MRSLRWLHVPGILILSLLLAAAGWIDLATECGVDVGPDGCVCARSHDDAAHVPGSSGSQHHHDSARCGCTCHNLSLPPIARDVIAPGPGRRHELTATASLRDCTHPPLLRPPIA